MNIFSITMMPIRAPFDDGPKNLVLGIARRIKGHYFMFISSFAQGFKLQDNITFIRSPFQNRFSFRMPFMQQIFTFTAIIFNLKRINTFQFFFTPRPYFSAVFGWLVKRFKKRSLQIVSSVHTLYNVNKNSSIKSLFFSDSIVVHSDYAKAKLEKEGLKNIIRIYPGVDLDRFRKDKLGAKDFWQKEKAEACYIIYPGTYRILNDYYSFDDFCKIIHLTREKIKDIKFVMACRLREKRDFFLEKEFKKTVKRHNLEGAIVFLNTVCDMPLLFNSCDIGILPSRKEMAYILEIPLVMLEMAALEKPVIYSDVYPLGELKQRQIGICLNDASSQSYADAIIDLLKDEPQAKEIGTLSKSAVFKDFNLDKQAAEYNGLYNSLE